MKKTIEERETDDMSEILVGGHKKGASFVLLNEWTLKRSKTYARENKLVC